MNNKERTIFYIISWMFLGAFAVMMNIENFIYIFSTYNKGGFATVIIYLVFIIAYLLACFTIFAIAFSWILNMAYIIEYKKRGYEFASYCFYPFIYIKTNKKKINFIFNIIYLVEIGSFINLNNKILSEKGIDDYIKDAKNIFKRLVYVHYALIVAGLLIAIFNFNLGGMIISYNIIIIIYNSTRESKYFNDGYIYLSKNLREDNLFNIMNPLLKVSNSRKSFIYKFLQEKCKEKYMDDKLSNKIICELYQEIMVESINSGIRYLDIEIEEMLKEEMARDAHFDEFSFLNNYRIYRIYSIYIYRLYGVDKYKDIIKLMNLFYEASKSMPFAQNSKSFKKDKMMLESYEFHKLNLKDYFDICNLFDTYKKKICLDKGDIQRRYINGN